MTAQKIREYLQTQPDMEAVVAGRVFEIGNNAAVTGIAPVQALPTTAAQWGIKNASTTKAMFFKSLGVFLTSGTPGVGGLLLATIYSAGTAISANKAGVAIRNSAGKDNVGAGSRISAALCNSGITVSSPTAPVWFPVASRPDANVTAFAGSTFLENRNIRGAICLPPGFFLGLAVVSPAGTSPLFAPFAQWEELAATVVG